jgi:hypothetical protein
MGAVPSVEAGLFVGRASPLVSRRSGEDAQPTKKHSPIRSSNQDGWRSYIEDLHAWVENPSYMPVMTHGSSESENTTEGGCMTAVARPPAAGRAIELRRSLTTEKERDGQIRIPALGRAFCALGRQYERRCRSVEVERSASNASTLQRPPGGQSCCWRKGVNARRPSRSGTSFPGGGFRIGPSLPSVRASHSTGPVAETVMHPRGWSSLQPAWRLIQMRQIG